MHRIPEDLDLSPAVGESTTQICVGQFELQFTFGPVCFVIWSPINIFRDGILIAHWEEGLWPDEDFYDIMNTEVTRCEVVNDRLIVFEFENGLKMHLEDSSDQYESMKITFEGDPTEWII